MISLLSLLIALNINCDDLKDYLGLWEGYASVLVYGYQIKIDFREILENDAKNMDNKNNYELTIKDKNKTKIKNKFNVYKSTENCYKVIIYFKQKSKDDEVYSGKICSEKDKLKISIFGLNGTAYFENLISKDTLIFYFNTGLNGKLKRKIIFRQSKKENKKTIENNENKISSFSINDITFKKY